MPLTFSIFRKIIQKRVFKNAPDDKLLIYTVLNAFKLCFHKNWFQLHHSKIWKKVKKYHFKTVRTFAFPFKVTSKQFSKIIVTKKSKKKKNQKLPFSKSQNICFPPEATLKKTKKNFCFKKFSRICLAFSENGFNFFSQEVGKEPKMSFPNSQTFASWMFIFILLYTRLQWIYNLQLLECQETPSLKQAQYLKFKWEQWDSNPSPNT